MAKSCAITGKSSQMGGGYSNRIRATKFNLTGKRRRHANLQKHTFFIPELNKSVRLVVSARGLKDINKKGVFQAFIDAGIITT